MADFHGGWTCCVEQGHYGHRARKATWLYANGVALPQLKWGPSAATARLDGGFHSAEERARARGRGVVPPRGDLPAREEFFKKWREQTGKDHWEAVKRVTGHATAATPLLFRDLLLSMARSFGPNDSREASQAGEFCDCGHGSADHWGGTEDCCACSCTALVARARGERTANDVVEVMSKRQRAVTPPNSATHCSTSHAQRKAADR